MLAAFNPYSTATNNIVKWTMVQSNGSNNIGRDEYTKPLNLNKVPRNLGAHNWCYGAVSNGLRNIHETVHLSLLHFLKVEDA